MIYRLISFLFFFYRMKRMTKSTHQAFRPGKPTNTITASKTPSELETFVEFVDSLKLKKEKSTSMFSTQKVRLCYMNRAREAVWSWLSYWFGSERMLGWQTETDGVPFILQRSVDIQTFCCTYYSNLALLVGGHSMC